MKIAKIGAYNGLLDRYSLEYKNPCNSGILIEPIPFLFEKLKTNVNNDKFDFLNVAVSNFTGKEWMYYIDEAPNWPSWYFQLGSLDCNHIKKHFTDTQMKKLCVKKIKVQVVTLDFLLIDYENLDVLFIDAEGSDFDILNSFSFRFKPLKIIYEWKHMSKNEETHIAQLLSKNYKLTKQRSNVMAEIK